MKKIAFTCLQWVNKPQINNPISRNPWEVIILGPVQKEDARITFQCKPLMPACVSETEKHHKKLDIGGGANCRERKEGAGERREWALRRFSGNFFLHLLLVRVRLRRGTFAVRAHACLGTTQTPTEEEEAAVFV